MIEYNCKVLCKTFFLQYAYVADWQKPICVDTGGGKKLEMKKRHFSEWDRYLNLRSLTDSRNKKLTTESEKGTQSTK